VPEMEMTLDIAFDLQCGVQDASDKFRRDTKRSFENMIIKSPYFYTKCLALLEKEGTENAEKIGYKLALKDSRRILKTMELKELANQFLSQSPEEVHS
jgi:hypothetical protein